MLIMSTPGSSSNPSSNMSEAQSNTVPSGSQASTQPNLRSKKDPTWRHITELRDGAGKSHIFVPFVKKNIQWWRMKQHLVRVPGSIAACPSCPGDIKFLIKSSLDENTKKAKEKHVGVLGNTSGMNVHNLYDDDDDDDEVQVLTQQTTQKNGKRKAPTSQTQIVPPFFKRGMHDPSQPSIKAALQRPSYHAMRVTLLKDVKQSVQLIVDSYRRYWAKNGCTTMGDGWPNTRQQPLINFMVYCAKWISFIKSVDASDIKSNARTLCSLFSEIVGRQNVVHLVTDNATNYKVAGRLLCLKYPSIVWSPSAAHCMNLIMKDMSEMPQVADLVTPALRTEIIRPHATRFGTAFITLKSLCDHKHDLQAMVTSLDYKKVIRLEKAKEVKLIILNENIWNNCAIIVKVMTPMLRLLRICYLDEKSTLGYVYEGMYRAKKGIKKLCCTKKEFYDPYTNIIKNRWDRMLHKSLHATTYYLNLVFQYDQESFCKKPEVVAGVMDMIEHYSSVATVNGLTLMDQLKLFREHEEITWRRCSGIAKICNSNLSQTTYFSGCEWNWSVFERIHTKRRNRLEHQRLNDLVYVHYNLCLQNRLKDHKKSYDPIDYESINKIEFWVVDEISEDDEEDDDGVALEQIDMDSFR
uniref:DUF659 domain-containing protein n=1 Tax=Lactuca sativa TaxID=4236 RepID=A0A9R1VXA8_LACSA|nr:hypothetical protein LSAT_V11C400224240 [Lactuca sativa]